MAFTSKIIFLVFMALLCLIVLLQQPSGCIRGHEGCTYGNIDVHVFQNRRVLYGLEKKVAFYNGVNVDHGQKKTVVVDGELREAPMGPDPLHHNGSGPKKPKITP